MLRLAPYVMAAHIAPLLVLPQSNHVYPAPLEHLAQLVLLAVDTAPLASGARLMLQHAAHAPQVNTVLAPLPAPAEVSYILEALASQHKAPMEAASHALPATLAQLHQEAHSLSAPLEDIVLLVRQLAVHVQQARIAPLLAPLQSQPAYPVRLEHLVPVLLLAVHTAPLASGVQLMLHHAAHAPQVNTALAPLPAPAEVSYTLEVRAPQHKAPMEAASHALPATLAQLHQEAHSLSAPLEDIVPLVRQIAVHVQQARIAPLLVPLQSQAACPAPLEHLVPPLPQAAVHTAPLASGARPMQPHVLTVLRANTALAPLPAPAEVSYILEAQALQYKVLEAEYYAHQVLIALLVAAHPCNAL
jgi:hypothetical protein